MIVYAESSAVLSWLFGEAEGEQARKILEGAEFVLSSDLTLVECDRAFHRGRTLREISDLQFRSLRQELRAVSSSWTLVGLGSEVVLRARDVFPGEPLRSLDALHLASALLVAGEQNSVTLLSLDRRVRDCAMELGLQVAPDSSLNVE